MRKPRDWYPVGPLESAPCGPLTPPHWLSVSPSEYAKPYSPYRENSWYRQTPACATPIPGLNRPAMPRDVAERARLNYGTNPWFIPTPMEVEAGYFQWFGPYGGPFIHNDR